MRFLSRLAILTAMTLSLAAIGSTRSLAADGYALTVIPPAMGGSPTAFRINIADRPSQQCFRFSARESH